MFKLVRVWAIVVLLCFMGIRLAAQERDWRYAAWSPDGNLIALSDSFTIELYTSQLEFIEQLSVVDSNHTLVHAFQMIWSPDSTLLGVKFFTEASPTGKFHIWDTIRHQKHELTTSRTFISFTWSPDSQAVAMLFEDGITIYSREGLLMRTYQPTINIPQGLIWLSESDHLLIKNNTNLEIWDISSLDAVKIATANAQVGSDLSYNPLKNQIAFLRSESKNQIDIWNIETKSLQHFKTLSVNTELVLDVAWTFSDHLAVLGSDGITTIWDIDTAQIINTVQTGIVYETLLNPTGTELLSLDRTHYVYIHDATTGAVLARLDTADLPEMP